MIKNSIISLTSGVGVHKSTLLTAGRSGHEVRRNQGHAYLPVSTNGAAVLMFSRVMPPYPTVAVGENRPVLGRACRREEVTKKGLMDKNWGAPLRLDSFGFKNH